MSLVLRAPGEKMVRKAPKAVWDLLEILAQPGHLVKRESSAFLDCRDIQEDKAPKGRSDSPDSQERVVRKE